MRTLIRILFSCILFIECINANTQSYGQWDSESTLFEHEDSADENYYNGTYCAEVTYYNPKNGRESEYKLTIEVDDNELERINFPSGYLRGEHFGSAEFDQEGYLKFTFDRGYEYTVQIIGESEAVSKGCTKSHSMLRYNHGRFTLQAFNR